MDSHLIGFGLPDQTFLILNQALQGDHSLDVPRCLLSIFAEVVRSRVTM